MTDDARSPLQRLVRRNLGAATQGLLLMALWLLLSGHYDGFHLGLGVLSVVFILFLNGRVRRLPVGETEVLAGIEFHAVRLARYLLWLPVQIFLSGAYVAYIVLHPRMPITPSLVRFRTAQPNVFAQMLLGNSITLTPGTLTVDVEGDAFIVHALTEGTRRSLLTGTMQEKIARVFQDRPGPMVFDVEPRWTEPET